MTYSTARQIVASMIEPGGNVVWNMNGSNPWKKPSNPMVAGESLSFCGLAFLGRAQCEVSESCKGWRIAPAIFWRERSGRRQNPEGDALANTGAKQPATLARGRVSAPLSIRPQGSIRRARPPPRRPRAGKHCILGHGRHPHPGSTRPKWQSHRCPAISTKKLTWRGIG